MSKKKITMYQTAIDAVAGMQPGENKLIPFPSNVEAFRVQLTKSGKENRLNYATKKIKEYDKLLIMCRLPEAMPDIATLLQK